MTIALPQASERGAALEAAPGEAAPSPAAAPAADTPAERPARLRPALVSQVRRMTAALPPGAWQLQAGLQLRALAQAVQQEQDPDPVDPGWGDDDTTREDASIVHALETQAAELQDEERAATDARTVQAAPAFAAASHSGAGGGTCADAGGEAAPHAKAATSIVDDVNRRIDGLPELRSPEALIEAVLARLQAGEERRTARLVLLGHCGAPALEHTPTGQAQLFTVLQALSSRPGPKRLLLPCSAHDGDAAGPAAIADALREARLVIASAASRDLAALVQALAHKHETIAIALVARVAHGDVREALRMHALLSSGVAALKPAPSLEQFAVWRTASPAAARGPSSGPKMDPQ